MLAWYSKYLLHRFHPGIMCVYLYVRNALLLSVHVDLQRRYHVQPALPCITYLLARAGSIVQHKKQIEKKILMVFINSRLVYNTYLYLYVQRSSYMLFLIMMIAILISNTLQIGKYNTVHTNILPWEYFVRNHI